MEREELLKSPEYWIAGIRVQMWEAIESSGISRKELTERAKVDRSYIDRIMSGDREINITMATKLLLAIGKVPKITIEELKDQQ